MSTSVETFFRPAETAREQVTLPAPIYNRCRLLLSRCATQCVFVPIRSMQYLAVIDTEEIIFVDNHGYAHRDGQGGRLIVIAWESGKQSTRTSLTEPVPIEIVYYEADGHDTQRRLMSEFPPALKLFEERQKAGATRCLTTTVLPYSAG